MGWPDPRRTTLGWVAARHHGQSWPSVVARSTADLKEGPVGAVVGWSYRWKAMLRRSLGLDGADLTHTETGTSANEGTTMLALQVPCMPKIPSIRRDCVISAQRPEFVVPSSDLVACQRRFGNVTHTHTRTHTHTHTHYYMYLCSVMCKWPCAVCEKPIHCALHVYRACLHQYRMTIKKNVQQVIKA